MSKFWQKLTDEYAKRKKAESVIEEKRIYVVVAETVDTQKGVIIQSCGRIAAQCAHVVSKMRVRRALDSGGGAEPITTIVLAAPGSEEMRWLRSNLHVDFRTFFDTNEEVYGPGQILTAICTYPVTKFALDGALDHLLFWNHGRAPAGPADERLKYMAETAEMNSKAASLSEPEQRNEAENATAFRELLALRAEVEGDNGLRAANAAGWAIARARAKIIAGLQNAVPA